RAPAEIRSVAALLEKRGEHRVDEMEFVTFAAGDVKKACLADWLEEEGQADSAALYRQAAKLYRDIQERGPDSSRRMAARLRTLARLEEAAVLSLRHPPRATPP